MAVDKPDYFIANKWELKSGVIPFPIQSDIIMYFLNKSVILFYIQVWFSVVWGTALHLENP